ncbi:hypothetical protein [Streptomyces cinereospinus]|uniref:Uncharacterized protein n=1 Tax=Streptomyces cinereospinus TaxID=285561 RepID=A0ABV5N744_9ACTN
MSRSVSCPWSLDEESLHEDLRRPAVPFERFTEPGDLIRTVPHDVRDPLHHLGRHGVPRDAPDSLAQPLLCLAPQFHRTRFGLARGLAAGVTARRPCTVTAMRIRRDISAP